MAATGGMAKPEGQASALLRVEPSVDTKAVDELARAAEERDDLLLAIGIRRKLVALHGAAAWAAETYARAQVCLQCQRVQELTAPAANLGDEFVRPEPQPHLETAVTTVFRKGQLAVPIQINLRSLVHRPVVPLSRLL